MGPQTVIKGPAEREQGQGQQAPSDERPTGGITLDAVSTGEKDSRQRGGACGRERWAD